MSLNYLMDTLGGSVECEINNSGVVNSTPILSKKFKANLSHSDLGSQLKQQIKYNTENFTSNNSLETNLDKLRFSEKLKVLLKNGKSKNNREVDEANAFKESDPQHNGSVTKSLNNFDSYFGKSSQSDVNTNNGSTQRSIVLSRSVRPELLNNELAEGKDCNGEITNNFNKNLKLSHIAVPIYAINNSGVTNVNQTGYSLHQVNQSERFKLSNFKNGKTPVHLPSSNKTGLNKLVGKSKLQNLKHTNLSNSLKGSRNIFGKPFGFGSSQMHKQGNTKVEKKHLDNKQRNFQKRKPLLNQFQKTALLNRAMGQGPRKNPPKAPFFGMARPSQKDSDVPNNPNSLNKNSNKISLLEESLLGLKSQGSDINNGNLKSKGDGSSSSKSDYLQSILETGSTTIAMPPRSTVSLDQSKHDSLERIWDIRNKLKGLKRDHHHFGLALNDGDSDESPNSECLLFQNYWFSVCNDSETVSSNNRRRDTKLSQLKVELRHKIKQLQWTYKDEYRDKVVELLVDSARKQPNLTAFLIRLENAKFKNRKKMSRVKPFNLLKPTLCSYANPDSGKKCGEQAMPCVKFCQQHITCSNDQLLFTTCSARRSDNTTCTAAVLNQNPENPLCLQHKRLENMAEIPKKVNSKPLSRPSQPRKRSRSSTGSSSRSGKSRKRKRSTQKDKKELSNGALSCSTTNDSSSNFSFVKQGYINDSFKRQNALTRITPQIISKCDMDESQEVEVGEEVLAMAADLPLELATQATKLLEEHDFTNVLNHIPADAFNDLFTEDKEEYEPTPQETEELERALEAVDKDVKSLEKLSQTQGILDTLLDEQTIAQTLAQLPEVAANLEVPQALVPVFYQNGFSNINQLEQTMHDVNKSLTQTVLLNQGTDGLSNHFVNNLTIPNHADLLQS